MIDADATGQTGPVVEFSIPVEIPARVLAALAGNADIHAVVVRNGVVLYAPGELNLGRTTRLANRAQRRALRGLYRCCAIPGCSVAYDRCKLHHVIWWRNGGPHRPGQPGSRLHVHHTKIHHDGWIIELGPNRELTLRLPDGTIRTTGPPGRPKPPPDPAGGHRARAPFQRSRSTGSRIRRNVDQSEGVAAPFGDEEAAEAVRVEQGFGFADPAAHPHRFEAGPGSLFGPDPLALLDQLVDPPSLEELRLGSHVVGFGQLIDRHVDRDVLRPGAAR